jgi:hypothetical protein
VCSAEPSSFAHMVPLFPTDQPASFTTGESGFRRYFTIQCPLEVPTLENLECRLFKEEPRALNEKLKGLKQRWRPFSCTEAKMFTNSDLEKIEIEGEKNNFNLLYKANKNKKIKSQLIRRSKKNKK